MKNILWALFILPLSSAAHFENAMKMVGVKTQTMGPNCWNYALYSAGLQTTIRNTDAAEFSFFIHSKLCQKLKPDSPIQKNQIGVIRDLQENGSSIENHAFVFENSTTVLTKNGPYNQVLFQRTNLKNMLAVESYHLNKNRILERYACQSLDQYVLSNLHLNPRLLNIWIELIRFESAYWTVTLLNHQLDFHLKNSILNKISNEINLLSNETLSTEDQFFKTVLVHLYEGMAGQIYYTYASPLMDEFENVSRRLKK